MNYSVSIRFVRDHGIDALRIRLGVRREHYAGSLARFESERAPYPNLLTETVKWRVEFVELCPDELQAPLFSLSPKCLPSAAQDPPRPEAAAINGGQKPASPIIRNPRIHVAVGRGVHRPTRRGRHSRVSPPGPSWGAGAFYVVGG